jgi:6-phosphogluconolactonase
MTIPSPPPPCCKKKTKKRKSKFACDARIFSLMKITRRFFAFLLILAAPALLLAAAATKQKPPAKRWFLAYVGTYTTKTNSKGIYAYRYDGETGKFSSLGVAGESTDPSFVAVHPSRKFLYAVNEAGKSSMVSAFRLEAKTGKLTLLNQLPALGEDPCYISFDKTGKYALVANYSSGNVGVFPILPDGRLGEHTALVQDSGPLGPNKERQEGPHAHWIETSPDNRFVLVSDLGLDEVLVYKFDAAKGTLSPNQPPFVRLKQGSGPRHVAIRPGGKFVYVVSELSSTITAFRFNSKAGTLHELQTVTTLPKDFSGRNDTAEIAVHPSGKFLYASNRGHESIAVFAVHPTKGTLTFLANVATGGKEPRHFAIDPGGNYLLAENQLSNNIVVFKIDLATGGLTPTGDVIDVPSPVDLAFLPVE